ncbi:MAG: SecD/SecF family protein translocase subunit [Ruminococcus sp.]|nr:SecD/SecF family protein translocase subunit [Ruminococcus sp.]
MKKTGKSTFFIVFAIIALFAFTAVVGLDSSYGDNTKTYIKGVDDIKKGIDIQGGIDITFEPDYDGDVSSSELDSAVQIMKTRLATLGITDNEVYSDSKSNRIIVRFPTQDDEDFDPDEAVSTLGSMAQLAFYKGDTVDAEKLVLTGADVEHADYDYRQTDNLGNKKWIVTLELKDSGTAAFAEATRELAGSETPISIWMDETKISAPTVNSVINDGSAIIEGNFTSESARELANQINGGSLPFAMKAVSVNRISSTLGEGSLDAMVLAAGIAFIFIAIYMIVLYRLPGCVAVIALIGQIAGSIAAVSGWFGFMSGSTLTIPGIAGIILAVGMGVDANIITGERIKEELRSGKSLDSAVRTAYKRAFSAILDGNVTNVIIAVILMGAFGVPTSLFSRILNKTIFFAFGATAEGFVYSFGFTLLAGVILNFIMGVFASRLMVTSLTKFKCFKNRKLYGGKVK